MRTSNGASPCADGGSIAGMPIGLLILVWINPRVLQIVIALTVVLFAVLLIRGLRIHGGGLVGTLRRG